MRIITILLCAFLTCALQAQTKSTIYLKDGSVLKGEIIEDTEYFIKIIIETGDTLQVGYRNIVNEPVHQKIIVERRPKFFKTEGYFGSIGISSHLNNSEGFTFSGQFGKRLTPKFNLGLGVNFNRRTDVIGNFWIEPEYLEVGPFARYYLTDANPRLFASAQVGYAFSVNSVDFGQWANVYDNSPIGNLNIGIHLSSRQGVKALFKAGVSYQQVNGRIAFFDGISGEIETIFKKRFITPTLGAMIEF